jgi:hypothetical protein
MSNQALTFAPLKIYRMSDFKFETNEIPYEVLAQFGLSHEMIEDLPTSILNDLTEGRRTPMLPVQVIDDEGNERRSRARIKLCRNDKGYVVPIFYPQAKECDLSQFDAEKQEQLRQGKAVIDYDVKEDGSKVKSFFQIDECNGQVLSVPTPVIGHNLQLIADEFGLHNAEILCIQNGDPLTFIVDDETVTCGIDLNSPAGVRLTKGDDREWREKPKREYSHYNFGVFGCWTVDEQGNLDYINEEDYTDELWNELKKSGAKRAANNNIHKI